ncbi:hypothetical protein Tco_1066647 [Tanacetum coccineum]|uniref:Uncharacterized protein n=1 Tax=Tanacetum coccineum TaxID=301880 RepID=A0ABQ5HCC1_9ASTR
MFRSSVSSLRLFSCTFKKSKDGERMAKLWDLPEHDSNDMQVVMVFYKGFDMSTGHQIVDSRGPVPNMTPAREKKTIQDMAKIWVVLRLIPILFKQIPKSLKLSCRVPQFYYDQGERILLMGKMAKEPSLIFNNVRFKHLPSCDGARNNGIKKSKHEIIKILASEKDEKSIEDTDSSFRAEAGWLPAPKVDEPNGLLLEAGCDCANELPKGPDVKSKPPNAGFCPNMDDPPKGDDEATPNAVLEVAPKAGVESQKRAMMKQQKTTWILLVVVVAELIDNAMDEVKI